VSQSPTAFLKSIEVEARSRRIPLKYLPQLDKGRALTAGYWLDVHASPTVRFEMFHWERDVRTPVFETYDPAEALRLILWHADTCARKAAS
jgi:hypothetical protein